MANRASSPVDVAVPVRGRAGVASVSCCSASSSSAPSLSAGASSGRDWAVLAVQHPHHSSSAAFLSAVSRGAASGG